MKDNLLNMMNSIARNNITSDELNKASDVADSLVSYYEEHIHSTVMDQMFENNAIEETDDKGVVLIKYAIGELLMKLNTN
jgi:hypothetical protein